jgi:NAD(P)-dependent dehydrogenase (short-subunit alcohol dehydrogenase family)
MSGSRGNESDERIEMNTDHVRSASGTSSLEGKVTIITGSSRGIGATTAKVFAGQGATVVLAARDEQALAAVADAIGGRGGGALVVPTDVNDPTSVERLVQKTMEAYGRLDAAVNNAGGGYPPVPLAALDLAEFDRVVGVNLRGVFLSMKYEIPAMLESGGGSIVNMTSTVGLRAWHGLGAYVAAKHGVVGLTESAALDYADQGVRINALAPGSIMTDRISALTEEQRAPIAQANPMRRIGLPEEVAATAAWLCSAEAAFVTGTTIPVDGGQLARA